MKNRLIIFSKNRACQLKLLLDSIKVNAKDLFDEVYVLYRPEKEYVTGYETIIQEYSGVKFRYEYDFKSSLMRYITDDMQFTTFMVDDAVIFKPITETKENILKTIDSDSICFSLRLGLNCNYSHPANLSYTLGEHEVNGEFMNFDYTKQQAGDFSYPLSTDGHIFNTWMLRMMLEQINFNNPNSMESALQRFVMLGILPSKIHCFTESKLVSIPVNLVNTTFKNRHGLEHYISEEYLEKKYINGECIDLSALDFTEVNGPHKEIKYVFKTK